jgi:lipoprotein-anchoring transpeptidase ErfK/SrfK
MFKKSLCLLISLSTLLAVPAEAASKRYKVRQPVVVDAGVSAPWVTQLAPRKVVYSTRQVVGRPMVYRNRKQQVIVYQPRPVARQEAGGIFGFYQTAPVRRAAFVQPKTEKRRQINPAYLPQVVAYQTKEKPGTIVIDTNNRFLYLVMGDGMARRYGVGVGKPGFEWSGAHRITRKQEWPTWNPPAEMRAREAAKGHILPVSMEGGVQNPLGARALYLGSTLYRIHGTNAPWTIGYAVSSGCIRMRNEDVVDLYERVKVGTRVIVI